VDLQVVQVHQDLQDLVVQVELQEVQVLQLNCSLICHLHQTAWMTAPWAGA
jgi:hypothetical protein